jgi:glycosyltransferase involved in cell wall biosynthesis
MISSVGTPHKELRSSPSGQGSEANEGQSNDGQRLSIVHILAPGAIGGLESVVHLLARTQRRAGHDVCVVTVLESDAPHPFVSALQLDGIDVRPIVVRGRAFSRERRLIAAILVATRPDVVHTHGYRPDLIDAPVARRLGVATASTVHGFTGGGAKMRLYEWLVRRAFRRFDAVIAVSHPLHERLLASGVPAGRLHEIVNAWSSREDTFVDRRAARRELGIPDTAFAIGWAGRISPEKGVDVFVRAIAGLQHITDLHACVFGSGPSEHEAQALAASLGAADRIRWYGTVPSVSRFFRAFDAIALTSRTEGTPIVLLESMAAMVPIVATSVGGVPDMLGPEEALLIPSNHAEPLASALDSVRREPLLAHARAVAARERLEQQFAVEPWAMRHEALYRSLRRQTPASSRS